MSDSAYKVITNYFPTLRKAETVQEADLTFNIRLIFNLIFPTVEQMVKYILTYIKFLC